MISMKRIVLLIGAMFAIFASITAQQAYNITAPHDPATVKMAEEDRGEVVKFEITDSPTYPGTTREVWVYVPKLYQDTAPACLLVCMDGILYDATTIMDNLIATGEMPVTIGVFVNPGVVYDENGEVVRYNRCKEFDSTDDRFVSFLEQEVLARVEGMQTQSGQTIRLSSDANDRAITGASSGGIAAFSAAWNRPDLFSRVYTTVGTFVAMRGGHEYAAIVRKTEPKPLRIYMQDGWYDVWNPIFGEWFEYNLLMESAFNFAGYEAFHVWNRGNHSIKYGTLAFPDAMRWLWKGYPARVQKGWSNNGMLQSILLPDCDWQIVATTGDISSDIYPAPNGQATYASGNKVYQINPTTREATSTTSLKTGDKLMGDGIILRGTSLYHNGKKVAEGLYDCQGVQALAENQYVVLCSDKTRATNRMRVLTQGERALAVSPDYRLCVSGQANTHHLLSTVMNQQGEMLYTEPFYYLQDLSNGTESKSGNMAFDTDGNLYVATALGVQVVDHNGRTRAILSLPAGEVQSLAFSGNYLYVVCGESIYVRQMKATGHNPAAGKVSYKSQGQG